MINEEPETDYDVPSYLLKYHKPMRKPVTSEFVQKMITWAEKEYTDVLHYYESIQDYRRYNIAKGRNLFDVLACSNIFKNMIKQGIPQDEWDKLPDVYQRALAHTAKLRFEKYLN